MIQENETHTRELLDKKKALEAEQASLKDLVVSLYDKLKDFGDKLNAQRTSYANKLEQLKRKKQQEMMENRDIEENFTGQAASAGSSSMKKMNFTHRLWHVVITIMTGIEMSVRAYDYDKKQHAPTDKDFLLKNIYEIHHVALDKYKSAAFFDYAPAIFHYFRKISGIYPESYLESLGPQILSKVVSGKQANFDGINSSGKSGSFFFKSADKKYYVKTIKSDEFDLIMDILPRYLEYISANPHSLISRIFGLHKISLKPKSGSREEWIIIVMQNIFCTSAELMQFDLKGSTYKRFTK